MRATLYVRLASNGEDTTQHLPDLRTRAHQLGYTVILEFVDYETALRVGRKHFHRMLLAAYQRRFDVLLFWSLERLTSEDVLKCLHYLQQLTAHGIRFLSHQEPHLTSVGPPRDTVLGLLTSITQYQAPRRQALSKAERAAIPGPTSREAQSRSKAELAAQVLHLVRHGAGPREVARALGIGVSTAQRHLRRANEQLAREATPPPS